MYVVAYDKRGFVKSDLLDIAYSMKILADDLKGAIDGLKIKKFHLMGRSRGGMITQNFTILYPEYLGRLILMTTNLILPNEEGAEILKKGREQEIKLLMKDPEKSFWKNARILFHQKYRKEMKKKSR
ncbi:MAG: alpha/beta fold hydrolase [Candidatus Lokiarchaeota archaeon]|nr:alpha/beta fold hydrolase [Candidatus Lokiarchaeota archaeon]MBD3339770.1 alpha/beta fold hydrolase [Candidatus Lokiarchaeota archaeon]